MGGIFCAPKQVALRVAAVTLHRSEAQHIKASGTHVGDNQNSYF
jgi:hypothetical protein